MMDSTKAQATLTEPSQSFGLQSALISPVPNTCKVEVGSRLSIPGQCSIYTIGGVPFHPKDQPPKAPCPLCVRNNQDQSDKKLYAIRGTAKNQYDDNIPAEYFQVPPLQLAKSGNEALRVCPSAGWLTLLLRNSQNASFNTFRWELYTWKDRESSIVACLAAMDPLSRALQSARDQLYKLRGDVSGIDNALQRAASLRVNAALPRGCPSSSSTDDIQVAPITKNIPAGSLLARGSAMDLQSIHDGVKPQDDWDSPLTAQAGQYTNEPSPKRRRLVTVDNLETQHQHELGTHRLQQRLTSRDAMPPPSGRLPKNHPPSQSRHWSSCQSQTLDQHTMEIINAHRPLPFDSNSYNERTISHISSPMQGETLTASRRGLIPNGTYSNASRSLLQQRNDGELDKASHASILGTRSSGLSTNRLSLPPMTPSVFKHITPRRRVGISANGRTSQPPFLTPESSSSLQGRFSHRNPGHINQPVESPHFSNQALPAPHNLQRPYTNSTALSMLPKSITSNVPQRFSWLPPPQRQVEHQDQERPQGEELQGGTGAYRRPGGPGHSVGEPPSLNYLSFMSKPQTKADIVGRKLGASSVNHGRRAARR
ncbi:MAG: hypothetical protein Q9209_006757 [Squamulea sp. 1 TL-2023]